MSNTKDNKRSEVLVAAATYNEADNLPVLLNKIFALNIRNLDVLVIDDNSPDGTGEIADRFAREDKRVSVIHREFKMGLGTAHIRAFRYFLEHDYDYLITMDADLSHDPMYIPDFLAAMPEYDCALSSRYVHGISVVNWDLSRLILSKWANFYVRNITGMKFSDMTGAYRCYRRKVIEALNLDAINSNGYAFMFEITYRVWKAGFKISEVPIVFVERLTGASKMSKKVIWEAMLVPWLLRFGLYKK